MSSLSPRRGAVLPVGLLLLCALLGLVALKGVHAKRSVHIPDDLSDTVDSEEDDDFAAWGRPKVKEDAAGGADGGIPMDAGGKVDVKKLLKKQASGPQLTFARLVPDPTGTRTLADVNALGAKWAALLRSGGMSEKVYGIDENTVLMSLTDGVFMEEVREFLWLQDEVDEFEWNSQVWRRGSDQPQAPKPKAPTPTPAPVPEKKKRKKKGKKGGSKRIKGAKEASNEKADL